MTLRFWEGEAVAEYTASMCVGHAAAIASFMMISSSLGREALGGEALTFANAASMLMKKSELVRK